NVASTSDLAAAATDHENREVLREVTIPFAHTGSINDRGVIQKGAVAVWSARQFFNVMREHRNVVVVDLRDLFHAFRVLLMVRDGMMRVGYANLRIRSAAKFPADHKGDYASDIALICEHLQVEHELDVLFECGRNTGGPVNDRDLRIMLYALLNPLFH